MKPITGYSEATATTFNSIERLPAGGYVLKILDVKEENYNWGDVIILRVEINEGERKGFFSKQYEAMNDEYKKWKGTYRLNVPSLKSDSEDDKKKYQRSLGFFKSQIEAINKSNNINVDCSTEWNINILKGKLIGAVYGNKEWAYNGKTGWFTNCDHLVNVQDIREGNFSIPKDKPLSNSTGSSGGTLANFEEVVGDDTVPF